MTADGREQTVDEEAPRRKGLFGARRAQVEEIVAEGLYIASAATRLMLKNRILVEVLAEGEHFDAAHFKAAARDALLELAREAEEDAARTATARKRASRRFSESDGTHDYRSRDVRNLKRRQKQSERVAAGLRDRANDKAELARLVEDAREAAWADVSRNLDRTLNIEAARPDLEPDYEVMRAARMEALRLVDLPRLEAHRRGVEEPAPDAG